MMEMKKLQVRLIRKIADACTQPGAGGFYMDFKNSFTCLRLRKTITLECVARSSSL